MDTHRPLPGIEVGDIGSKFGFNGKDNGYLKFDNIRVPRRNLLMRYVKVDKSGNVTLEGDPKIAYSVMLETRLSILMMTPSFLSRASTIAIRYGICRT